MTVPLLRGSWAFKSMGKSHPVQDSGLSRCCMPHLVLSIKKKHQGLPLPWSLLTLYQIPILPHRQRAEEAQRERVPDKKAMKQEDPRTPRGSTLASQR